MLLRELLNSSSFCVLLAAIVIDAPYSARATAHANPIPEEAPTIRARLFFNENEGIEMEATYFNDTDEIVEFGLLSVDEMMIVFGLYFTGEQLNNDVQNTLPQSPLLYSNFPNPFNPNTLLRYDLPESGMVNITIHDMIGRKIKTLVNSAQSAGYKTIQWNGTDDKNEPVSAGLYLYTIQTRGFTQTKKMVLLK